MPIRVKDLFFQLVIHDQSKITVTGHGLYFLKIFAYFGFLLLLSGKGDLYLAAVDNGFLIVLSVYRIVGFLMKYGIQIAHHDIRRALSHLDNGVGSAFG